jgi:hypothetical protein
VLVVGLVTCCHLSGNGGCLLLSVGGGHPWPIVMVVGSHHHWWRVVDYSSLWGLCVIVIVILEINGI